MLILYLIIDILCASFMQFDSLVPAKIESNKFIFKSIYCFYSYYAMRLSRNRFSK